MIAGQLQCDRDACPSWQSFGGGADETFDRLYDSGWYTVNYGILTWFFCSPECLMHWAAGLTPNETVEIKD